MANCCHGGWVADVGTTPVAPPILRNPAGLKLNFQLPSSMRKMNGPTTNARSFILKAIPMPACPNSWQKVATKLTRMTCTNPR
jgi:hypothetical protein